MRIPTLIAAFGLLATGHAAEPQAEKHLVDDRLIPVSNKGTISLAVRENDDDVKNRELWYRSYADGSWSSWSKHGITFGPNTPIQWKPTEGHWQIYVRIEEISGLIAPAPDADSRPHGEFIIDRTAPSAGISYPATGAELQGGKSYTITWDANDPHMHSTPITIGWARSGEDNFTAIAESVPNTGEYEWTTPMDMTAAGRLRLEAVDRAGNTGTSISTNIIIDAVAPSARINGPSITASRAVDLDIRASDAGPAGLAKVVLYYSNNGGSAWNKGPVAVPEAGDAAFKPTVLAWNAPADGVYDLYLRAEDDAGNTSPEPKGAMARAVELIVDTQQPKITLLSPIGVKDPDDKPGGPLRRVFKPGTEVTVPFQIQDMNLAAKSVTVSFQGDESAAWKTIGSELDPDKSFSFKIPDISTRAARIRVEAIDAAGNVGSATASDGFRIDNKVETPGVSIEL